MGIFTLTDGKTITRQPTVFRIPNLWNASFVKWANLGDPFKPLRDALNASPDVRVKGGRLLGKFVTNTYNGVDSGDRVTVHAKACLLNLFGKLINCVKEPTFNRKPWFGFVQQILEIGRERLIALVEEEMLVRVTKIHTDIDQFPDYKRTPVGDHNRNIPAGFTFSKSSMVSVKTKEDTGNLQLTLTPATDAEGKSVTILDADIDENGKLMAHLGNLFKHAFTGGTHPFDIHRVPAPRGQDSLPGSGSFERPSAEAQALRGCRNIIRGRTVLLLFALLTATVAAVVVARRFAHAPARERSQPGARSQPRNLYAPISDEERLRARLFQLVRPVTITNWQAGALRRAQRRRLACSAAICCVPRGPAYWYGISGYDGWGCEVSRRFADVPVHESRLLRHTASPRVPRGNAIFHAECVGTEPATNRGGGPSIRSRVRLHANGDAGKQRRREDRRRGRRVGSLHPDASACARADRSDGGRVSRGR